MEITTAAAGHMACQRLEAAPVLPPSRAWDSSKALMRTS